MRAEGWKWVEVAPDFPYGHTARMRRLIGTPIPLTEADQAERDQLQAEYDRLRVDRGYVRPEPVPVPDAEGSVSVQAGTIPLAVGATSVTADPSEEEDGLKPLPDRLITELTAHRTLALRDALGRAPGVAFQAVLHALCLRAFYRRGAESCLEIETKSATFAAQAPGLADTASAKAIDARHQNWLGQLPADAADLWDALTGFDGDSQAALFAHCASLTVNAMHDPWNRRPRGLSHADRLARAVGLDMAAAGWVPTVRHLSRQGHQGPDPGSGARGQGRGFGADD
ncbi:hypothetical protein [Magnetospirillum molischianum]|uniref:ParB domain protein nuclease n=1 Tax=Magnetospirillum molischianum DSM 120 TaxID=1150626 RepID=H8FWS6_MAGML